MTHERFPLPGDAWVDFRPVEEVSERHRRAVTRLNARMARTSPEFREMVIRAKDDLDSVDMAAAMASLTEEGYEASEEMNDALIVALVAAWSFDAEITVDGVLDLPTTAYQPLLIEVAKRGKGLFLNADVTPDAESPTGP